MASARSLGPKSLNLLSLLAAAILLPGCLPEPTAFKPGVVDTPDTGGGGRNDTTTGTDATKIDSSTGKECSSAAECGEATGICRQVFCDNGKCGEEDRSDNTVCDDGNPCTKDDRCKTGACVPGAPLDCDDANPCTEDKCESADGSCTHTNADGKACDDGEACTANESCLDGACSNAKAKWVCVCNPDAPDGDALSCSSKNPANKCKGSYYCHRDDKNFYVCDINPATVATCDSSEDTDCLKNWCDPKVGKCEFTPIETVKGVPNQKCDDGDACTTGDACKDGKCIAPTMLCQCTPFDLKTCFTTQNMKNDPCKGQVYCANAGKGPAPSGADPKEWTHCAINPASVVQCPNSNDTPCAVNQCVVEGEVGVCKMTAVNTYALCEDGDPCTPTNTVCNKDGSCDGTFKQKCDVDGKCLDNKGKPNPGQVCEDGICVVPCSSSNPCVLGSVCVEGYCVLKTCGCEKDADCANKEDGDACNGTLYCDKSIGQCVLNKATVVGTCPTVDDTACIRNICYPQLGVCKLTPAENIKKEEFKDSASGATTVKVIPYPVKRVNAYCEDGDPCTPVDECNKGVCVPDDTNTCFCKKDADCVDDGNLCNGTSYCDLGTGQGTCKINPVTVVKCAGNNDSACVKNVCDAKTGKCGLKPTPGVVYCDDGDPCTAVSDCKDGKCQPGTPICACTSNADCASQEDGNVCNGTLFCNLLTKQCETNPATVVKCSTANDTECLANTCDPKLGTCSMQPANNFKACDAGDPCLASPVCFNGSCFAESNLCQCVVDADCAKYDDGNACNGTPYCDKSVPGKFACKVNPASIVTCPDPGNSCLTAQCNKASGTCETLPKPDNVILCDDGNPCTKGDSCVAGACTAGANFCQCQSDNDCAPFDDGNPCNGKFICEKGDGKSLCKINPATVITCEAAKAGSCLVSACNPATAKCESISGTTCSDGDACTADSCDPKLDTCIHTPVSDGVQCDVLGSPGICTGDGKGKSSCVKKPAADVVYIPAGSSFRGCSTADSAVCQADEKPQQEVSFSKGLWMSRFEVTVAQYTACVTAGKCSAPVLKAVGCTYEAKDGNAALNCVAPTEAKAFCTYYGTLVSKVGRLPTEAEWERAARGGCESFSAGTCKDAVRSYPWGNVPEASCTMAVMQSATGVAGCDSKGPLYPGSRPNDRSLYDVYDLVGNLSEWVADTYAAGAYSAGASPVTDPVNTAAGNQVVRGGNYNAIAAEMRAGRRSSAPAATVTIGFRCVIEQ